MWANSRAGLCHVIAGAVESGRSSSSLLLAARGAGGGET